MLISVRLHNLGVKWKKLCCITWLKINNVGFGTVYWNLQDLKGNDTKVLKSRWFVTVTVANSSDHCSSRVLADRDKPKQCVTKYPQSPINSTLYVNQRINIIRMEGNRQSTSQCGIERQILVPHQLHQRLVPHWIGTRRRMVIIGLAVDVTGTPWCGLIENQFNFNVFFFFYKLCRYLERGGDLMGIERKGHTVDQFVKKLNNSGEHFCNKNIIS